MVVLDCMLCIKRALLSPDKGNTLMSGSVAAPGLLSSIKGGLMIGSKWHPHSLI
jgi:hypothetical protein